MLSIRTWKSRTRRNTYVACFDRCVCESHPPDCAGCFHDGKTELEAIENLKREFGLITEKTDKNPR